HAGGERPRGARGDPRVHGPLRRQPGRPQVARNGDRCADGEAAGGDGGMKVKRFAWKGPTATATAARGWFKEAWERIDLASEVRVIGKEVVADGDAALLRLTEQLDGVALDRRRLRVDPGEIEAALKTLDPALREAMELAAANIRTVAEGQVE